MAAAESPKEPCAQQTAVVTCLRRPHQEKGWRRGRRRLIRRPLPASGNAPEQLQQRQPHRSLSPPHRPNEEPSASWLRYGHGADNQIASVLLHNDPPPDRMTMTNGVPCCIHFVIDGRSRRSLIFAGAGVADDWSRRSRGMMVW